jgi:hypothetical protein
MCSSLVDLLPDGVGWCVDSSSDSILVVDKLRGWSEEDGRYRCVVPDQGRG